MQHPDEGTIHAWIDSALSPAEAARIEAHVATCSACAAMVAEARGLVAASSRIVGHLDVVPGNVIPATPAKAKLSLVRSRWPVAIAATLILGVTLYSRSSEAPSELSKETTMHDVATMAADTTALAPVTRPAPSQTPPPPPSIGPSARERQAATEPVAQRMAAVGVATDAANRSSTDPIVSTTAVSAQPLAKAAVAGGRASESGIGSLAASAAAPAMAPTPTPTPTATASPSRSMPSATSARREASLAQPEFAETNVVSRLIGCYEMNASTETFPARFALVADPVPGSPGLLAVRYLDANGRLSDRILDAGWSIEGERAVVKTVARNPILTLSRTGASVAAQSPNGPRTGRVSSCREF